MALVVFDSDVLIAYLGRNDAQHEKAVERVRLALRPGTRRLVSAVNYAEILIGPLRAADPTAAEKVDEMFVRFAIETVAVDMALAHRAASVRARTKLKLPDAFALATAIDAEERWRDEVRLESFDEDVAKAHAALRSG